MKTPVASRALLRLFLVGLLLLPAAAVADEDPGEMANRATTLFMDPATRSEALALYHQALGRAAGSVRTAILKNLGKAYGAMDRFAEAWPYLHFAFLAEGGADTAIRDALEFVRGKLARDHVEVRILSVPERAVVTFPGEGGPHRFRAPATWWFTPGSHTVRLTLAGHRDREVALEVKPGPGMTETVTLEPAEVPSTTPGRTEEPGTGPVFWAVPAWKWALLGGGLALAAGGAATWLAGWDRAGELNRSFTGRVAPGQVEARTAAYDRRWRDEVKPLQVSSWVLWGVGGAAAVTGLVLALTDGPAPARPQPEGGVSSTLRVLPAAGPGFAGVGLEWPLW
ncbi:MAG: hypothetical protein FJ098_06810 [Deltaproteobacteria bacterium]|nr:hypothetical protein [Deltaproteobacteria bacterium]